MYTIPEAAQFARLSPSTVRRWFKGRDGRPPVREPAYKSSQGLQYLSFLDLVEVRVVGWLYELKVDWKKVRLGYKYATDELQIERPFARADICSDGQSVYIERAAKPLIDLAASNGQQVSEFIRQHVEQFEFDSKTKAALRWHISEGVLIDPARSFGQPIALNSGLPADMLYNAYKANGRDAHLVGSWYDVPASDVLQCARFMEEQQRPAA